MNLKELQQFGVSPYGCANGLNVFDFNDVDKVMSQLYKINQNSTSNIVNPFIYNYDGFGGWFLKSEVEK